MFTQAIQAQFNQVFAQIETEINLKNKKIEELESEINELKTAIRCITNLKDANSDNTYKKELDKYCKTPEFSARILKALENDDLTLANGLIAGQHLDPKYVDHLSAICHFYRIKHHKNSKQYIGSVKRLSELNSKGVVINVR